MLEKLIRVDKVAKLLVHKNQHLYRFYVQPRGLQEDMFSNVRAKHLDHHVQVKNGMIEEKATTYPSKMKRRYVSKTKEYSLSGNKVLIEDCYNFHEEGNTIPEHLNCQEAKSIHVRKERKVNV